MEIRRLYELEPFKDISEYKDWIPEVVNLHIKESEAWSDWFKEKRVNARDINSFEDLSEHASARTLEESLQIENILRNTDCVKLIPKSVRKVYKKALVIGETGGTTGDAKRVPFTTDFFNIAAKWASDYLDSMGAEKGYNWLCLVPTGPHSIGHWIVKFIQEREGIPFLIDLDPRFVKQIFTDAELRKKYMEHVVAQITPIIKSQEIKGLFATSKFLQMLAPMLSKLEIKTVVHGGTELKPDVYKMFVEEVYNKATFLGLYGNGLGAMSIQRPLERDETYDVDYIPWTPFTVIELVNESDGSPVDYGMEGRVKLYILRPECIVPGFWERDLATKIRPFGKFAKKHNQAYWLRNVRTPYTGTVKEGVY